MILCSLDRWLKYRSLSREKSLGLSTNRRLNRWSLKILVNLEVSLKDLEDSLGLAEPQGVVAALEAELELILSTQIQSNHQVVVQLMGHLLRVH